jgi:hypothetical protein
LQDAMVEVARFLLNKNHHLVYGGDLNYGGGFNFTELLFQLAMTYGGSDIRVTNYSVFPLFVKITKTREADVKRVAKIVRIASSRKYNEWMTKRYETMTASERGYIDSLMNEQTDEFKKIWSENLTHMRTEMTKVIDARIVIGGKLNSYKGRMPGVVEETLMAIENNTTVFLDGRMGGAAQFLIQSIKDKSLSEKYGNEFAGLQKIKSEYLTENSIVIRGKTKLPELERFFTHFL